MKTKEHITLKDINWKCKDKKYWKTIFAQARKYGLTTCAGYKYYNKTAADLIRLHKHNNNRPKPKHKMMDPLKDYGYLIGREINRLLYSYSSGEDFRWALASSKNQMRRYKKAQKNGCCGFFDKKVTVCLKEYWIGFNFGH